VQPHDEPAGADRSETSRRKELVTLVWITNWVGVGESSLDLVVFGKWISAFVFRNSFDPSKLVGTVHGSQSELDLIPAENAAFNQPLDVGMLTPTLSVVTNKCRIEVVTEGNSFGSMNGAKHLVLCGSAVYSSFRYFDSIPRGIGVKPTIPDVPQSTAHVQNTFPLGRVLAEKCEHRSQVFALMPFRFGHRSPSALVAMTFSLPD